MKKIFNNLTADISAGIAVFLVALPLCIGIAIASNAPILSGIISGIIAGLVVSMFSGSELSVSGPAAGLIVIVSAGIANAGSFEVFLCSLILAGILQIILGILRCGFIASFFPTSVISGMLAAIGMLIILKQIPHAIGFDTDFEGDESFAQMDHHNTFTGIVDAIQTPQWGIVLTTLFCMAIIWFWNRKKTDSKILNFIPSSLLAVSAAIVLNEIFALWLPTFKIEPTHLVQLPAIDSFSGLGGALHFPKFDASKLNVILSNALVIGIIASVESLLSVEAIDKLDFNHGISDKNRELKAQGIGNICCGLLGGIPVTSVILRSSANVYAGAKTRFSVFVHGLLLLFAVLTVPFLLNKIPLAALAAILFSIGYKLTNLSLFKKSYRAGIDQFTPFLATIIGILVTDLLTGVLIGVAFSMFFVMITNYHSAITVVSEGNNYLIRFTKDVSFVNKFKLELELNRIPGGSSILLDGTNAMFIDKDIYAVIEDFQKRAHLKDIKIEIKNMLTKTLNVVLFGKKNAFVSKTAALQQGLGQRKEGSSS